MRYLGLVGAALLAGCGGEFILTAPDVVGLTGQTAPAVVRLQRREFWLYAPALADAPISFRIGDGPVRAARTDKFGYAAVALEIPARPGRYDADLRHQDREGETVAARAAVYAFEPDRPAAIVDLDSLPRGGKPRADAAAALRRIEEHAQIIYATEELGRSSERTRRALERLGYPDGPVVPCAFGRPWYSRMMWWRPGEANMAAALRQRLPALRWGIAGNDDSAETFRDAGLVVLGVADAGARKASTEFFRSWAEVRLPDSSSP